MMFVFCKRKTAYELRISDWSSDVCSSDLEPADRVAVAADVLGRRIDDDVRAVVERTADHRRGGVVDDERHAQLVADGGDFADREDLQLRIGQRLRSEEHTSELQSLMRISYAVFCLKKKK